MCWIESNEGAIFQSQSQTDKQNMEKKFGLFVWINDNPITGNVLNLTNIKEPRKSIYEYQEGDHVLAKCHGHGYCDAQIGKISGKPIHTESNLFYYGILSTLAHSIGL